MGAQRVYNTKFYITRTVGHDFTGRIRCYGTSVAAVEISAARPWITATTPAERPPPTWRRESIVERSRILYFWCTRILYVYIYYIIYEITKEWKKKKIPALYHDTRIIIIIFDIIIYYYAQPTRSNNNNTARSVYNAIGELMKRTTVYYYLYYTYRSASITRYLIL